VVHFGSSSPRLDRAIVCSFGLSKRCEIVQPIKVGYYCELQVVCTMTCIYTLSTWESCSTCYILYIERIGSVPDQTASESITKLGSCNT
jgi:hypothetical protein